MSSPYLRNCWYVAAFGHEVSRRLLARTLLDEPVLLWRTEAGQAVALADRCPHRAVPLSRGKLVGDTVQCSYHGLRMGPDGRCREVPCQPRIPEALSCKSYPVLERHGLCWVWMGQPERADAAAVPDVHWLDHPDWTACTGYHHVRANYQLLNDNLLDLSHESFLHERTIGNDAVARAPVSAAVLDGVVRVHRDIHDCEPPPFYIKATGFASRIHRWHTTIYRPPGFNLIENGAFPVGQDKSQALQRRIIHLGTPETSTSSHYFWGIARQYQRDDNALTEYIREQSARTFDEDKDMLEAQQRALGTGDGSGFLTALVTDAGPLHARRLLQRLIEQDSP